MMALAFGLLFLPVCATISGLVLWLTARGHTLDDSDLIRNFTVMFLMCLAIGYGISRTDAMRMRLDPQFRMASELEAHPVYATVKRVSPDDHKELSKYLVLLMSQGVSVPDAFVQVRPLLTALTNHRHGWADQKAHLTWARVTVDTLKELQARDPALCYRALSTQMADQPTVAGTFSAANTQAFQHAVVEVYDSAGRGIRNLKSPSDEKPVEFNAAALEYQAIHEAVTRKFGVAAATQLSNQNILKPSSEPADRICAARIFQLETMLERPQAMAATLLDSVLR